MKYAGLGRHAPMEEDAGNPLDGIVNLFDLGIVLAVGFLVAALGAVELRSDQRQRPDTAQRPAPQSSIEQRGTTVTPPADAKPTTGSGRAVGTVYELSDGRLVYVRGRKDER